MTKKEFILGLFETGAVKFGEFVLKSGIVSPFYLDLRDIISDNELVRAAAEMMAEKARELDFDYVSGIPYTALPVAVLMAQQLNKPLVYARKEPKAYGTKNTILGKYEKGKKCLIVDDLITSGESILEAAGKFQEAGLKTRDFMVIIDRSTGGEELLNKKGFRLHSLIRLDEMVQTLFEEKKLNRSQVEKINDFMRTLRERKPARPPEFHFPARQILNLINRKKSRKVYYINAGSPEQLFEKIENIGNEAVMLMINAATISNKTAGFWNRLEELKRKYDFLLLDDSHFANPGKSVELVKLPVDFISVHTVSGTKVLENNFQNDVFPSAFLYARIDEPGSLTGDAYMRKVFETGKKYPEKVSGYICHAGTPEEVMSMKNKIAPNQLLMIIPGERLTGAMAEEAGADLILIKN